MMTVSTHPPGRGRTLLAAALGISLLVCMTGSSELQAAGGVSLPNQSTKATGFAFANAPTVNDSAAAAWFNPAGLAFLSKRHFNLGGGVLIPLGGKFHGQAQYNPEQQDPGEEPLQISGSGSGEPALPALVPELYYAHPITDKLTFGIGLNSPIGFVLKYPDHFEGRNFSVDNVLLSVNTGPQFGYQVTPNFAIGGGVNVEYVFNTISNSVDTGTRIEDQFDTDCPRIVNSTGSQALGGLLGDLGLGNLVDGTVQGLPVDEVLCPAIKPSGLAGKFNFSNRFKASDIGFGYNLGFMWQATTKTRIGAHFRSKIDHRLTGEADRDFKGNRTSYARRIENEPTAQTLKAVLTTREAATGNTAGQSYESIVTLQALQNAADGDIAYDLPTPESFSLGISHRFNPKWRLLASYEWTRWSRLDDVRFHYTDKPKFYDNIFQQVAGRKLRPSERVDRRDNPSVQPLNWKDAARYALGVGYRYSKRLTLRGGIAYAEGMVDGSNRRPIAPYGARRFLTFGFSYQLRPGLTLDNTIGITRLQGGNVSDTTSAARTYNQINGHYDDLTLIGAGATLRWRY